MEILGNGFVLTAPNRAKMQVTAPAEQVTGEINVSRVKYGGSTSQHNNGIGFGDRYFQYNMAIDLPINKNIQVLNELTR